MAKAIVLGIPGEENLWLVDLDAGTVTQTRTPAAGALGDANKLRQSGVAVVKGVDFAVAVNSASSVASGFMDS